MSGKVALLLDLGGVVLTTPFERHRAVETKLGLEAGTLRWMGPFDAKRDELWQQMQAGRISERDYWHRRAADIGRAAGRALSLRDYMALMFDAPEADIVRPQALDVVHAVRAARRKVGVLTNDLQAFHGPHWRLRFFDLLDSLTDGSVTGVLKPDPRAYAHALAALGAAAQDVLFVDDQAGNVDGARAVGIETIQFDVTDASGAWQAIHERLLGTGPGQA